MPVVAATATNLTAHAGDDFCPNGQRWFSEAAQDVYGKDAGLGLHHATGVPERSCYRYASGERALPSEVLRLLVHSDQGEPFFRAFMHGCTAPWWLEFQHHAAVGAKVVEITKQPAP